MKLSTAGQGLARFAGIGGRDGGVALAQPVNINKAISGQRLFDDDTVKPFNDFGLSVAQSRELQTRNSSIGTHNMQGKLEIFSNDLFFSYRRGFVLLTDCI